MSRSQGAANGGWQSQRPPAGEPDPRTGGRPAQRPQAPQQAPQYAAARPAELRLSARRATASRRRRLRLQCPAAGLPLSAAGQAPQYAPPQAPAAPPINRQGLSSLDSARNAHDARLRQLPAHAAPGLRAAGASGAAATAAPAADASAPMRRTARPPIGPHPRCRRLPPAAPQPQYAPRAARQAAPELRSVAGTGAAVARPLWP